MSKEAADASLEELAEFPHLQDAIEYRHRELDAYLNRLRQDADTEVPKGYIKQYPSQWRLNISIEPHVSVPLLLKRLGAPIGITVNDDGVSAYIAPEIDNAYKELWKEVGSTDQRFLASRMAQGLISAYDAMPNGFHVVPLQNSEIIWAHGQGILPRAFITSALSEYDEIAAPDFDGVYDERMAHIKQENFDAIASKLEALIGEEKVIPFSLETVLGMGVAPALAALAKNPELAVRLGIDPETLPSVDLARLEYSDEAFKHDWESYFGPLLEKEPT